MTDPELAAAITAPPVAMPPFAEGAISEERRYLFGPQRPFWIPVAGGDAAGSYGGGLLSLSDPVGKLSSVLIATAGSADSWRGGRLASTWRGWPTEISGAAQIAGKQFDVSTIAGNQAVDVRYRGLQLDATRTLSFPHKQLSLSVGGWIGESGDAHTRVDRRLGFASLVAAATRQSGTRSIGTSISANFEAGETNARDWRRFTAGARADIRMSGPDIGLSANYSRMFNSDVPGEALLLGGGQSPLLDARTTGNHISSPLLRHAIAPGSELIRARAEVTGILPLTAFTEWNWPRSASEDYFAISGLSFSVLAPRTPQLALPDIAIELGGGAVVAGPYSRRISFFGQLRIRP